MARTLVGDRVNDRPLLILGAGGQLGEVATVVLGRQWPCVAWTRAELDLTDGARVINTIGELRPWAIVNCAGYNLVDEAEKRQTTALEANAFVVRSLARAAADVNATLVHYSTDFVFDGHTTAPYREDDRPNPRSVYAASKLLGEWFAADTPAHYVLRVESLFGGITRRKGSLNKIIDSIEAGQVTPVFTDRVISPSYVWDVAEATAALLRTRPSFGVYHCVNSGAATWLAVATQVKQQLRSGAQLQEITIDEKRLLAPRPKYSALSNEKLRAAGVVMPTWQDALTRELEARRGTR